MKTLNKKISDMEKLAFTFLRAGLETVLVCCLLFTASILVSRNASPIDAATEFSMLREAAVYIPLSLALVIGGSIFIDYAVKHEGK